MQDFEFKLPDIGEGVTEGEIVTWFVKPGDHVNEDDAMVEVMTDKATVAIGAPKTGVVKSVLVEVGKIAAVGQVIVTISTDNAHDNKTSDRPSRPVATAVGDIRESVPGAGYFRTEPEPKDDATSMSPEVHQTSAGHMRSPAEDHFDPKPLATPATRKLAKELGVDLRRVTPTGEGSRVCRQDVERAAGAPAAASNDHALPEERVPFVGMRRKIAERMREAKDNAAHFTFVEECDATKLVQLRRSLMPLAQGREVQLTYLPFVIKAVARALSAHPILNSSLDTETNELVYKRYYNVGMAIATGAGLVVAVIRDADKLGLFGLSDEIKRLSDGARKGTLKPQDLKGSTFTVTSLGKQSGLFATPILNHPEVGILGVHRIKEKPVVHNGQIIIGQVMNISLSFDHRIVDGHVGAAFAYDVIDRLENPASLFADFI